VVSDRDLGAGLADAAAKEKEWNLERESLRKELTDMQENVKSSVTALESQMASLKGSLAQAEADRDKLQQSHAEHEAQLKAVTDSARVDLDSLRHENKALEVRCADAEHKVQMFLDQVETSVDNYRRTSRLEQQHVRVPGLQPVGLQPLGHQPVLIAAKGTDVDSLYSTTTNEEDDDDEDDRETETGDSPSSHHNLSQKSAANKRRDRTSTALDTLTTELDALRSRWETTSRNYKLSEQFDFEKSPSSATSGAHGTTGISAPGSSGGGPLASAFTGGDRFPRWAKGLETDTESLASEESAEKLLATPPRPTPSAVTAAATAAAAAAASQHGPIHPANGATTATK